MKKLVLALATVSALSSTGMAQGSYSYADNDALSSTSSFILSFCAIEGGCLNRKEVLMAKESAAFFIADGQKDALLVRAFEILRENNPSSSVSDFELAVAILEAQ